MLFRSGYFDLSRNLEVVLRNDAMAQRIAALTRRRFPDLQIPYHSRWRHFEAGGVDLVIGGHWHAYARQVSDNPEIGAGTVYLTHQDARVHSKKGGYFVIDLDAVRQHGSLRTYTPAWARDRQRLLRNWPASCALHRWLDDHLPPA